MPSGRRKRKAAKKKKMESMATKQASEMNSSDAVVKQLKQEDTMAPIRQPEVLSIVGVDGNEMKSTENLGKDYKVVVVVVSNLDKEEKNMNAQDQDKAHPPPQPVQRTSWLNFCGIFDAFSGPDE